MKLRISSITGMYLLLLMAVFNASLRLNEGGMSSLFRILSPLVVCWIVCRRYKVLTKSIICFLVGVLYSVFVSLLGYGVVSYEYIVFAVYIFAVFVIMVDIRERSNDFEHSFWLFLNALTTLVIILSFVQMFVRIPFPFVNLPRYPGVNLFMSNENELAEPLGFISLIYFYRFLFGKKKDIFWVLAIIAILFINDAKLTIIGCFVGYCLLLILKQKSRSQGKKFSTGMTLVSITISVLVLITLLYVINPVITFRDYSVSIKDQIFDPIIHILKLKPMPGAGGSMVDRTNAIIHGLTELKESNFLGIGWGNSILMLSFSEYHLLTAKSMHNIVFQFLCEMGIFAFVVYALIIKWTVKNIKTIDVCVNSVLKVAFVVSFIFISSQSSVGILSNYYSWIIIFYVFFIQSKSNMIRCPNKGIKNYE